MSKQIIRTFLIILILFSVFGCNSESSRYSNQFELFKKEFPESQAEVLDEIIQSFNEFLIINYPNQKTVGAKTEEYLFSLENKTSLFDTSWDFNTNKNIQMLKRFEDSGLRKEFYLWGYEYEENPYKTYYEVWLLDSNSREVPRPPFGDQQQYLLKQIQEFDSTYSIKTNSKFVNTTKKYLNEPDLNNYFKVFSAENNMSPVILIEGLPQVLSEEELSNPIIQLLIFRELFYTQMVMDIERKKGHNII
jgi:hypothetical protein